MPFANLPTHEKDAFFALLDEYFTSRPDLLSRVAGAAATGPGQEHTEMQQQPALVPPAAAAAMTTAAQRALANPAATRKLAMGIQRAATSTGSSTGSGGAVGSAANRNAIASAASMAPFAAAALPSLASAAASSSAAHRNGAQVGNDGHHGANAPSAGFGVGRVAAAAQAFSGAAPPPTPASASSAATAPSKPATPGRLVPQKKFGDVDVSSTGAMFRSLRGSTAAKNAPPPTVYTQPAFAKKSAFAPPPVRRVSAATPAPEPETEEDAQPEPGEEVAAGEWAEALYDYSSEEATDLNLRAGERVWVTEQTSEDWWTGEIDGRSGLFPTAYVKLL